MSSSRFQQIHGEIALQFLFLCPLPTIKHDADGHEICCHQRNSVQFHPVIKTDKGGLHGNVWNDGVEFRSVHLETNLCGELSSLLSVQKFFCSLQVFRGVNADGFNVADAHLDFITILKPAELLE